MRKLRRMPWRLPKPLNAIPPVATATAPDESIAHASDADDIGNRIRPEFNNGERRRPREPVLARYPRRAAGRNSTPYQSRDHERKREREEEPAQPVAYSGGRYVYGHGSTHEPHSAGSHRNQHRAHDDEFVPTVIPPGT